MDHSVLIHSPDEGRLGCFSEMVLIVTSLEEARDAAEHPPIHPHSKDYPTQNVSSTEVEKRY